MNAVDPDGRLEVLGIKVPGGYQYHIVFDSKLERANRVAVALQSLILRLLGVPKIVGWAIKGGNEIDKRYRGKPVRVFGEDTGVAYISGALDGPRFEQRVRREFFKRMARRPFYGERASEALRSAIEAVVDELLNKNRISYEERRKILKVYDVDEIFARARNQATPSFSDWFVGVGSMMMDDGTAASTIVRCNGRYAFANQCD